VTVATPRTTGFIAVRIAWGGLLAAAPGALFGAVTGRSAGPRERLLLRFLGVRHVLQGVAEAAYPTRRMLELGSAVDALHAASCGGAALLLPDWRRAALLDGTYAAALSGYGMACARVAGR
jgi:hypothetical protein